MCMCLVCLYTRRVQDASLALYLNFSLSFWICRKSTCRIHCSSAAVRARMCVGGFESLILASAQGHLERLHETKDINNGSTY